MLTGPGHALLEGLRGHDPAADLALVTRLRRDHPAALVSAALTQARLRQRAAAKFGADAERMFFTPDGLEQATRASVADWRAARFALLGVRRIADLGCGIGGDAIALARAGLTVLAVDRSPLTCAVARANAEALGLADRIDVVRADVTEAAPEAAAYCDAAFLDPARRTGGSRVFDPESYAPPLSWAVAVARRMEHAALKVAPGIPHEAVPEDAEGEWVSDAGDVKEAVLWFGAGTAAGRYRATLLPGGHSRTGGTRPGPPPRTGPPGRYLYEPDGAVIRARLIPELAAELDAPPLDPDIAYLSGDTLHRTPYATAYEITDVLPFGLKRLRALVRERAIGTLTIKKRGFAMTPEQVRGRLRLSGPETATLLLTRIAGAPTMLLGHPVPPPPGP
nr:methyltransferase domain-containing protein [Streptomyces aidingensis]